ncbi:high affinity cationic amino acid transporter 1-like isoform X1 [Styela clava]
MAMAKFLNKLIRKKPYREAAESDTSHGTTLKRCLTTIDLIALGVGSTLGAGVYVLTGSVARDKTGPAVVVSFFVAAVASVMAGLCYAEFGARVPKAGSAYVYSYVTVGEFWAFIIGWNLILEYVIGTSSVARAWSENFDALIGGRFEQFSMTYLRIDIPGVAKYPDFFAFVVIIILTVILCCGVKESATFSKIFTGVNIVVILFVIVAGGIKSNINYWYLTEDNITDYFVQECGTANNTSNNISVLLNNSLAIEPGTNFAVKIEKVDETIGSKNDLNCTLNEEGKYNVVDRFGTGGYFPYGFSGVMSGAATCFFGFVGFDVIATTGEEVQNPQRAIPMSIVISLLIVFFAYFGVSSVLTLVVPYYMLDVGAPLPQAFAYLGWNWAVYPLAIGATCALSASLLGGLFPLPRVVYAMAQDGLIFKFLARINRRFKTPVIATAISGLLAAIMVLIFDLEDLVDMMSIGTLLAYTLVAVCVLILRYQPSMSVEMVERREKGFPMAEASNTSLLSNIKQPSNEPTETSGKLVYIATMIIGFFAFILCAMLVNINSLPYLATVVVCPILGCFIIILVFIILRQPQSQEKLSFTVPFVPLLPVLSSICNIYLMCELSVETWIRFAVWMAIGFSIYFFYGIRKSEEERKSRREREQREQILENLLT